MAQKLKVVIPMAGFGKRLRPHTWSRPKQLLGLAGKAVIEHVLDTFNTLPGDVQLEYVFIVGYLGDKIQEFMADEHPQKDRSNDRKQRYKDKTKDEHIKVSVCNIPDGDHADYLKDLEDDQHSKNKCKYKQAWG